MPCLVEESVVSLQPSPLLIAFARRQIRNAERFAASERRIEVRHPIVMPVIVQPIDEQFRAIGDPLAMVTRDISARGFGLIHEEPVNHNWLALRLTMSEDEAVLVGEVRWRKHAGPFYACGCEVIAKLDDLPE